MSNNEKRPLILFSGGLDSTALLYNALQKGCVDVISVESVIDSTKAEAERAARNAIYNWIASNMRRIIVRRYVVTRMDGFFADQKRMQFSQPLVWLTSAMVRVDDQEHSSVQVGYVAGDQVLPYMRDMQDAWKSLSAFTKHGYVPLEFPLAFHTKQDLWEMLPEELVKLTWTCEWPRILPENHPDYGDPRKRYYECGRCVPCRRMLADRFAHPDQWEYEKHAEQYFWKYRSKSLEANPQFEMDLREPLDLG